MKKIISLTVIMCILLSLCPAYAAEGTAEKVMTQTQYTETVCDIIQEYDGESEYFSEIAVAIGESNLSIDGETVPIDESGSSAYVENGRTMMPVRGLAEAMGADVSYDDATRTVTIATEETTVHMTIGENEMQINGENVALQTAPKIKNSRTILPARDVAEALACDVDWDQNTKTATFTRPLQTKRIIVFSGNADTTVRRDRCHMEEQL